MSSGIGRAVNRRRHGLAIHRVQLADRPTRALSVAMPVLAYNTCPIEPACGLKGALEEAQRAFFGTLDEYTLADFVPIAPALLLFVFNTGRSIAIARPAPISARQP